MPSIDKPTTLVDTSIFLFIFFLPFLPPVSYVALLVALFLHFRKVGLGTILHFQPKSFGWALLGFVAAVGLSVVFSVHKVSSLVAFGLFIFYPLSCVLIASNIRKESGANRVLTAIMLSGLVITTFGIVQYLARIDLNYEIGFLTISLRATEGLGSTLGNPNKFAKYLILILPLSLVSLMVERNPKRMVLPAVFLISGLVCLALTRSLGGMAAFFAVAMVILLLKNWKIFMLVMVGISVLTFFNYGWIVEKIP